MRDMVYSGPLKNRWICGKTRRRRHDTMDNVRRILSVGLVTLSALVLAGPPASAQEGTLKKIKETGTITLGHRDASIRSEEHTSELQSHSDLVCRLLLEKKKKKREETKINHFQ